MKSFALRENAYAKVNLALDILGKRADGYHDLKTMMASVSLCDDLEITLTPCADGRERFAAESNNPALPTDDDNLAVKAARMFFLAAGVAGYEVHIRIEKRIPVCAGLGGGSSDAAAVLRALSSRFPMPESILESLALNLGSDVPYCLRGGVCLAEGRGERLTPLPSLPDCHIVLTVPPVRVSTAAAFQSVVVPAMKTDWVLLTDALRRRDIAAIAGYMKNSFPDVHSDARECLRRAGALGTVMSGSGPSVFGVFHDEAIANQAVRKLRAIFLNTFLTKPV